MLLQPGGGGRLAAVAVVPYSGGAAVGRTAGMAPHPGHLRPLSLPLSAFHSSEWGPHSTLRAVPPGHQWQQRGGERLFLLRTRCGASTGAGAGPEQPKGTSSKGRAPLQQRAPVPRPPQPEVLPEPPTADPPRRPPSAGPSSNSGGGGKSRDPWAAVQQQQRSFQDQHHQQRQHRQLQHHGRPGRASREKDGSVDASTRGTDASSGSGGGGASILDDFLGPPGGARGATDGASRGGDAAAGGSHGEAAHEHEQGATRGEWQDWEGEGHRGGDSAMGGPGGPGPRSSSSRPTAGVPREWYAQLSPEWVPEKEFRRAMASAPQGVPGPGAAASGAALQGIARGDEGSGAGHLWGAQGEGHWGGAQKGRKHGGSETEERLEHESVRRTLYNFLHSKYATGEELCPRDVVFVAENVLRFHPKAASKIGAGVTGMKVDVHPLFPDTKCFFVRSCGRPDWEDFSYLKCLEARRRGALAARAQAAAREELKEGLGAAGGSSATAEAGEGLLSGHQAAQREEEGEGVGQAEAARSALSSESDRHSDGHSGIGGHGGSASGTGNGRSLQARTGGSQQTGDGLASPAPSGAGHASGMPLTNGRSSSGASETGHMSGVPLGSVTGHASRGFSQGHSANGHAGNTNGQVTSGESASDGAPSNGHAKVDARDDQVDSETALYL